mgnify:FL=1|tara:strand:- start:144 stop:617 length:474 start_codon:yes stop_codon:yes gene_type:complete
MKKIFIGGTQVRKLLICFAFLLSLHSWSDSYEDEAIKSAMKALDSFMETFNSQDMKSWSETLNYPHVRFSGGNVKVWASKEEYASIDIFDRLKETGWHYSAWLSRDVILVSEKKVHISTVFQRYNKSNEPIEKYQSLYIVTREEGHWGVKARSSLAP